MYDACTCKYANARGTASRTTAGVTPATTAMAKATLTAQVRADCTISPSMVSTASVSLENRFSRRPDGWESKKAMGRRTTRSSRRVCRVRAAVTEPATVAYARMAWAFEGGVPAECGETLGGGWRAGSPHSNPALHPQTVRNLRAKPQTPLACTARLDTPSDA